MRSTIVAAAFAVGALAVPYHKRDVVTNVEVVYATQYVTVYASEEATSAPAPAPAPTTATTTTTHVNHFFWHKSKSSSSVEAPPAYSEPPPSSTYVAPAPTSTYVAPAPSSEEAAPAPSPYEAPAPSSYEAPPPSSYAAPSSSAAPATSAASAAKPTDYAGIAVYHHNLHRANHSSPDLAWDDQLASTASKIAQSCVYAHDTDTDADLYENGYGQNIAAGVESNNISAVITDLFYNGEINYYEGNYNLDTIDMSNFEKWGHMTQIVWKGTTHIGCATQDCSGQGLANVGSLVSPYFTVCNYKAPGNYAGEYKENVLEPKGLPTCQWDEGL